MKSQFLCSHRVQISYWRFALKYVTRMRIRFYCKVPVLAKPTCSLGRIIHWDVDFTLVLLLKTYQEWGLLWGSSFSLVMCFCLQGLELEMPLASLPTRNLELRRREVISLQCGAPSRLCLSVSKQTSSKWKYLLCNLSMAHLRGKLELIFLVRLPHLHLPSM